MNNKKNDKWTLFQFASGSNPYIAKTKKEKERILQKYNCLFIEEENNKYFILDIYSLNSYNCFDITKYNKNIIDLINEELTLYINDEVGEKFKQKFEDMTDEQKINLFYNALLFNESIRDFDTFRIDLVINFDYNNY